jgi:hypothetical protein
MNRNTVSLSSPLWLLLCASACTIVTPGDDDGGATGTTAADATGDLPTTGGETGVIDPGDVPPEELPPPPDAGERGAACRLER